MISKVKRTINLGKKECLVCGQKFQPASGAQLTCSPECKAEARKKGLTKRGPRTARGGVDPALEEASAAPENAPRNDGMKAFFNGQPVDPVDRLPVVEVPARASTVPTLPRPRAIPPKPVKACISLSEDSPLPELEIDLTPVEKYLKFLVQREVHQVLKAGLKEAVQEALGDHIKEAVREEIAERLKGLLSP